MRPWYSFFLIGLGVAGLEEFITQGVLKDNLGGWFMPTLLAFIPFLAMTRMLGGLLGRRLGEARGALVHFVSAGGIGLLFEWWVMGLSPWSHPTLLQIPFQLGMFSFWSTVACAPRILLDRRAPVSRVRKTYLRFLGLGFLLIYGVALTAPREARFASVIAGVLLSFIVLNVVYVRYLRTLGQAAEAERKAVHP